jgi:hypothetical protein
MQPVVVAVVTVAWAVEVEAVEELADPAVQPSRATVAMAVMDK